MMGSTRWALFGIVVRAGKGEFIGDRVKVMVIRRNMGGGERGDKMAKRRRGRRDERRRQT